MKDRQEIIAVLDLHDVGAFQADNPPSYRETLTDALMELPEVGLTREQLGTAAAKAIIYNLPLDGFGEPKRLEEYAAIWGNAAADAFLKLIGRAYH